MSEGVRDGSENKHSWRVSSEAFLLPRGVGVQGTTLPTTAQCQSLRVSVNSPPCECEL